MILLMTQQQKMVPTQRNMQNKISALQVRFPRDASASLFVFYEQTVKKWKFPDDCGKIKEEKKKKRYKWVKKKKVPKGDKIWVWQWLH